MRFEHVMALVGLVALAAPAQAQTHGGNQHDSALPHGGQNHPAGPYSGLEQRQIKALSEQQIADLRAGRGLGLALPAELNSYPGPSHVLELADTLALTEDQRTRTKALVEAMTAETILLGEQIIGQEAILDRHFAERSVTPDTLTAATSRIGALQGQLRAAHLRYHLTMRGLLSAEQVERYDEKRGYRQPR